MPSGAVSEVLIPLESESLIRVDAIQLYSDPDIQRHSSKMVKIDSNLNAIYLIEC